MPGAATREIISSLLLCADDPDFIVRRQLALTLGVFRAADASTGEDARATLARLAERDDYYEMRVAIMSSPMCSHGSGKSRRVLRGNGRPLLHRLGGMSESTDQPQGLEIRTYFVRNRNALVARADFGELYVDYYLHQAQHDFRHLPEHAELMKDALAALTLHCASRPLNENTAWTIHFADPLVNLFVTGDNVRGAVVGQLFTENVKEDGRNLLMSDILRGDPRHGYEPPRRSVVELTGTDVFGAVERFYERSEQRPARLFRCAEEDFVMVSAHPDCDMEWFEALDDSAVRVLDRGEELSLLERRFYRWDCGCTGLRMMQVLAPMMRNDPDQLFGDESSLRMSCPRCGARHAITREALEAYVAEGK